MIQLAEKTITWAQGRDTSAWFQFGTDAPNGLDLPQGFEGRKLLLLGARSLSDGSGMDPATVRRLFDIDGGLVMLSIPTEVSAEPVGLVWSPFALRARGWIALRSVDAAMAPVTQSQARSVVWLFPSPNF